MNEKLTFGGYPIELEWVDNEVLIHCKGLTGTLTQVEGFIKEKNGKRHFFDKSKIRKWRNHEIKIDCLQDSKEQFNYLYEQAKIYRDEQR